MIVLKTAIFIVLLLLAIIFAYYNLQEVEIKFFTYSLKLPLFLSILVSFISGFLIAYLSSEIRYAGVRRFGDRLKKALRKFWTGKYAGAESDLSKLLDDEEVIPLYVEVLEQLGKNPSLYLQKYSLGIVETSLAMKVFRKDRNRAKNLLEKALGKNWENLEARRALRSIYFLDGEFDKAIDLQRSLVEDSDKQVRDIERSILASMLAEARGDKALHEIEKLPLTPFSLAVLVMSKSPKDRRKYISKVFDLGIQNEVILILTDRNGLFPELVEIVENRRSDMSGIVLAFLYSSLGMHEKVEELKGNLPQQLRSLIAKGEENRECLHLWECSVCGKEYSTYTCVCENCLSWNKLRTKGGSSV